MLRINLLPVRQLKKRAKARNQIIGFAMVFMAVLATLAFVGLLKVNEVERIQGEIAVLKQEQAKLQPIIREVEALEREIQELVNRIDVIKKLRKESSLTVHILDEVSNIIDNNRMWLESLTQQGSSLKLKGVALDNQTIAQFMESLKGSEYIKGVSLTNSTLKKVSDRPFKTFGLSVSVGFPESNEDGAGQAGAAQ